MKRTTLIITAALVIAPFSTAMAVINIDPKKYHEEHEAQKRARALNAQNPQTQPPAKPATRKDVANDITTSNADTIESPKPNNER
ncbi:MAG: hypothetical protein WCO69_00915 [Candidatus Omnitrophota bacterium]